MKQTEAYVVAGLVTLGVFALAAMIGGLIYFTARLLGME